MPRLDDPGLQKFFKKKEYRAWDDNACAQLKIKNSVIFSEENKIDIKKDIETDINNINGYQKGYQEDTDEVNRYRKGNQIRYQNRYQISVENSNQEKLSESSLDLKLHVRTLSGHQLNLFKLLLSYCVDNGELLTGPITIKEIQNKMNIGILSIKLAIIRLSEKGIIVRREGKKGRSGFQNFHIPREVKEMGIDRILKNSTTATQSEKDIKMALKKDIEIASSSSFINTTTEDAINSKLQNIDIEPLSTIGFSIHHLTQITSQNKLTTEVIQQSINAFAFDLAENEKAKKIAGSPLNFFMGILRKGTPYLPPSNYETPEDRAMRIFVERKKETERRRLEVEEEALKLACGEWLESLSEEDKESLIPEEAKKFGGQGYRMASLRTYFKENLWPKKKAEILSVM